MSSQAPSTPPSTPPSAAEPQPPPEAPRPTPAARGGRSRWLTLAIALGAVALVVALGSWLVTRMRAPELHGTVLQAPDAISDVTLIGTDNQPVRLSDLQGKWAALYFGYTFCPDVCPTTLADLDAMVEQLGNRADDIQVAFVSIDPARDTPERMAQYLAYFNPSFLGLTGDAQSINAAATQFGVFYEAREVEGASGYLMDHTSTVVLVDPEGRARMVFPYGVSGKDMADDVRYMMRRS